MSHQDSAGRQASPGRRLVSNLVLTAGFGLTGTATVMLGLVLPAISHQWGLRDESAGFLLFLQFLGGSLGAILSGADRVRTLLIGYGLAAASAFFLAFAGAHLSLALFFCFGLGLGMAMTATSLLFSDRYGADRAAMLERLNFAWSAGATVAPVLFLPLRVFSLHFSPLLEGTNFRAIYFTFPWLFLLLLGWVFFRERHEIAVSTSVVADGLETAGPQGGMGLHHLRPLLPLLALAMCAVGVEGALSGWLTTYAHRADPLHAERAAGTTFLFLFGIMASRLAFSTRLLAILGRRRVLDVMLWGATAALALLMVAHNPALIRVAAGLAGVGIGPLYPLLLSFMLEHTSRGWIFAAAGAGSAVLPWLTGLLSTHYGSLHYGLIAPCAAALLMILLLAVSFRPMEASLAS